MADREPDLAAILDVHADEIARIDEALVLDVVGAAQAADELHQALDLLDEHLDARRFDHAAQLGYRDIASAFVFLQRTLGALQGTEHDRSALISDVAGAMGCEWEKAEPHVIARMDGMRPRGEGRADEADEAERPATVTPAGRVTVPKAVREALGLGREQGLRFKRLPGGGVEVVAEDRADLRKLRARLRHDGGGADD